VAVVVTLMMMLALGALGGALTLLSVGETRIVANFRSGAEAIYAADAGIEVALNHLALLPDWKAAVAGGVASPYVDGGPGLRHTAAGQIDLIAETNRARSAPPNFLWQLYAYGPLSGLSQVPGINSDVYVVVWVAEHPVDRGRDMAILLARAYGPHGVRRAVEADVARTVISTVRVTSWHEVR
jgi:hypothetical protein